MPRVFIPATGAKTVPTVRSAVYDIAEVFIKGAVLGVAADGEVIELATAAVATICGVALEDAYSRPGYNAANDDKIVFRTGVNREVSMVDLVEDPDQIFSGRLTDGAGVDVLPTQTMIGESRGLLRLADGTWTVNNDDVATPAVKIVDIVLMEGSPPADNYVLFKFLSTVLA